jgi:hypothetical protein
MSDTDIHSCGYYCDRHACIVAQRDELRDKLFEIRIPVRNIQNSDNQAAESAQAWVKTYSGGKPNYTQPIEKEWVGLTDAEIELLCEQADHSSWKAIELTQARLKEKNL